MKSVGGNLKREIVKKNDIIKERFKCVIFYFDRARAS